MFSELNGTQQVLMIGILVLNILSFTLFYVDKQRAVRKSRNRISEKMLLTSSFVLGGIGALLGMSIIRHKTQHPRFKILVPIAAVITLFVMLMVTGDIETLTNLFS